jgi:hypothetical protein
MPKGPQGQKRKADVIGNAVLIGKIATGEVEDTQRDPGTEADWQVERQVVSQFEFLDCFSTGQRL